MAANKKPLRLSRVAREFNLGLQTIVEFLNEKGIDVEAKPNTKITPEAYDLLIQEFESDKTAKEESKKIGLSHSNRETVTLEEETAEQEETTPSEEPEKEAEDKELSTPQEEEAETPLAVETEETTEPVEEQPEEKVQPEKTAEKQEDTVKTEGKEEDDSQDKAAPSKTESEESQPEEEPVQEEKTEQEPEQEKKETSEKQPQESEEKDKAIEKETKESETKEEQTKEAEPKGNGLNIQGKIDLDKIDSSTRPVKKKKKKPTQTAKKEEETKKPDQKKTPKSKPEAEKQAEQSKEQPKEEAEKKAPKKENEFLKTEFEKLKGPNILGKIDLPESKKKEKDSKKKPVASSSEDKANKNKRKKRKRIKKAVDPKDVQKSGDKKDQQKKAEESKQQSKRQKRKSKRKQVKQEPSEEEVQKQIKETLEKLSSSGKSKAAKYRREKRKVASESRIKEEEQKEQEKETLQVTEFVTANDLANMMDVDVNEVISSCMSMGMFVSINQRLDAETITILADEFGYDVDFVSVEEQEEVEVEEEDDPDKLQPRAPIVTVMGHVDHGKTSLLDHIRRTNVIAGESGGITQHVGAYEVELPDDRSITFVDTPGHEAFTAMRARGANVTDIAIIVIAADDRIMPQTKEAINHAQAAGVPIIFAINKIDKPGANPEKVKEDLANMNLLVEEWGGKYQSQDISAKNGVNVDDLLEKILLEAELQELKANPDKQAIGTVLESSLDRGRGYIAKLLVQGGTLKVGDIVLAGSHYGRVKAMFNERNQSVESAGPSEPVLMLGLHGAPNAGDRFSVMQDEHETKNIALKRQQLQREQGIRSQKHVTLDEIGRRIAIGEFKELNIIVKGDVDGSVEALSDELLKLSNEEVQVNVIHKSVGAIIESDVLLASASDAIIIGFQVRPTSGARKLAEQEQIDIRTYSIIYEAKQQVMDAIEGLLAPEVKEKVVANLEVRDVFKISKVGTIAGCYVLDGRLHRNNKVRLIRDGIVTYTGRLGSLKRFKEDVKEVVKGYECGLNIENFNDIKVGDIIEGFETYEVKRSLDDMKTGKKDQQKDKGKKDKR
ncbi:MAG: translation initiation factor IF-2 [Bacteroidales bacterium]|nr:translation initiation factor IF-2 [Bacteroidales bacterium]